MEYIKKFFYFQWLRYKLSTTNLALLLLFFSLLIPTHPFNGASSHWIEVVDCEKEQEAYELLKIYSIVRSQSMDLGDATAWTISQTILEESRKHSLDPILVLALISVESRFQSAAVSTEGARGLMQIRPFVANALAEEVELTRWEGEESLDDPILNIKLGVFYLQYLKRSFRDLKLALTAYNWGPTEIKNRLEEDKAVPLEYAMKVLATYHSYRRETDRADRIR